MVALAPTLKRAKIRFTLLLLICCFCKRINTIVVDSTKDTLVQTRTLDLIAKR